MASGARTAVVHRRRAGLIAAVAGHARPVSFQQHRLRSLRVLNILQTSKGKRELKKHSCACACAWRHVLGGAAQPAPRRTLSLTAMGRATSWMPVSHAPAPSSVGAAPPPRGPARSSGGTSYREACVSLPPGPLGSSCPGAAVPRRLASSASMNFSLQFVASCCGRPQVPGCEERVKGGALHSHLGVLLPDHLLLLRAERVSQAQALLLVSRRLHLVGGSKAAWRVVLGLPDTHPTEAAYLGRRRRALRRQGAEACHVQTLWVGQAHTRGVRLETSPPLPQAQVKHTRDRARSCCSRRVSSNRCLSQRAAGVSRAGRHARRWVVFSLHTAARPRWARAPPPPPRPRRRQPCACGSCAPWCCWLACF